MFRTKTAKKATKRVTLDISGGNPSDVSSGSGVERNSNVLRTENALSILLNAESQVSHQRPWLRLERGIRMRLLRAYVDKREDLLPTERTELLIVLVEALDKKLLNSKSQITYNQETGDIYEINALKIIHPSEGKTTFRIEPPNRSTKKAKRGSGGHESD